jgi:hypothetical protein
MMMMIIVASRRESSLIRVQNHDGDLVSSNSKSSTFAKAEGSRRHGEKFILGPFILELFDTGVQCFTA